MEYRIVAIQTVFGEERERRLKLAFDIIWNLKIKKTEVGDPCHQSQNTNEAKEVSQEDVHLSRETERYSNNQKA